MHLFIVLKADRNFEQTEKTSQQQRILHIFQIAVSKHEIKINSRFWNTITYCFEIQSNLMELE